MRQNTYRWLRLQQLDKKLASVRTLAKDAPVPAVGWLKTLREALGMSVTQLAGRLELSQSTVTRLEKSEQTGTASLKSIRKMADALDCDIYYAIIPRDSLEQRVRDRAADVAHKDLARVKRTMTLESQSPDNWVNESQHEERRYALLAGSWRKLWQ